MVGCKKRLTFSTVENDSIDLLVRRRGELDVGRETCPTHADDPGIFYFPDNLFFGKAVPINRLGIQSFFPLILPVGGDKHGHGILPARVGVRFDGFNLAACARMNSCGNKTISVTDQLPLFNFASDLYQRFGRFAEMLVQGDGQFCRNRHYFYGNIFCKLAFRRMNASRFECLHL